jgi:hypothetical protein
MVLFFALAVVAFGTVGLGLAVAGAFSWIDRHRTRRKELFEALAARLGFDIVEAQGVTLREAMADASAQPYQRFGLHRPRAIHGRWHLVRGSGTAVVRLGDVVGLGDGSDDVTLATLEDPSLDLPLFSVRPRGAFGAPFERAVALPQDTEFEGRFEVFTPDAEAVRAILSAPVRALFVARGPRWYWQGSGQTLAVEPGGRAEADEAEALVAALEALAWALSRSQPANPLDHREK